MLIADEGKVELYRLTEGAHNRCEQEPDDSSGISASDVLSVPRHKNGRGIVAHEAKRRSLGNISLETLLRFSTQYLFSGTSTTGLSLIHST